MFIKSILATAAIAATVAFGAATSAQADPNVHFNFGIGVGFPFNDGGFDQGPEPFYGQHFHHRHHFHRDWNDFADAPPPPPRPRVTYGMSCSAGRNLLRQQGFQNVQAYSCQGPVYGYQAWQDGEFVRVAVNFRGQIVSVQPGY